MRLGATEILMCNGEDRTHIPDLPNPVARRTRMHPPRPPAGLELTQSHINTTQIEAINFFQLRRSYTNTSELTEAHLVCRWSALKYKNLFFFSWSSLNFTRTSLAPGDFSASSLRAARSVGTLPDSAIRGPPAAGFMTPREISFPIAD